MIGARVRGITFKSGATPNSAPLEVSPSHCVVLVGPNNSGKSTALREIEEWCWNLSIDGKVVASLDAEVPATAIDGTPVVVVFFKIPVANPLINVPFIFTTVNAVAPVASPV